MSNERDALLSNGSAPVANASIWKGLWAGVAAFFALTTASLLAYDVRSPSVSNPRSDANLPTEKHVRSPKSTSGKYIATQFISFTINTMGGLAEEGECDGLVVDESTGSCYLGNAKNMTADLYHRIQIVAKVIQALQNDAFKERPRIDHADHVLKIVMLPEFYARGPNGGKSFMSLPDCLKRSYLLYSLLHVAAP